MKVSPKIHCLFIDQLWWIFYSKTLPHFKLVRFGDLNQRVHLVIISEWIFNDFIIMKSFWNIEVVRDENRKS